jgi:hypothetical protein
LTVLRRKKGLAQAPGRCGVQPAMIESGFRQAPGDTVFSREGACETGERPPGVAAGPNRAHLNLSPDQRMPVMSRRRPHVWNSTSR